MVTLLARLNATSIDWVGTSMGGVIGLGLASLNDTPIRKLVLNDVGPRVEWAFVERLRSYLGLPLRWATLDEAADYLWSISKSFGPHTREQWLALSEPQLRRDGDAYVLHYDPAIGAPVAALTPEAAAAGEALMWAAYDRVRSPTLLLRGVESDLLSHATAQAMTQRGPKARLVEFAGVGHAPTLIQSDQVKVVHDFLHEP
jgi:pimeloyl-ACP methyl ester carboxylesterase